MVRQAAEVTLSISERLRLSSGHNAYGSAARPLRPQIKDGNNLITYPIGLLQFIKVLLVQPSSAAAERVFSILNSSFNDSQEHALVNYLQACVMLRYSNR